MMARVVISISAAAVGEGVGWVGMDVDSYLRFCDEEWIEEMSNLSNLIACMQTRQKGGESDGKFGYVTKTLLM